MIILQKEKKDNKPCVSGSAFLYTDYSVISINGEHASYILHITQFLESVLYHIYTIIQ